MSSIVPCAPSNSTDFPSSSARFTNSAVSQMYPRIFSPSFSVSSTSCEKSMSAPRHLVFIRGSDSARSRANFVRAAGSFRGFVQFAVIRENQMGAIADVQTPLHVNSRFRKRLDLRYQRSRIHDHARTAHGVAFRPQNPARDELQHKAVFSDDDGVPGVVAAGNARDVIKRTRKVVHHLAFALIAPLCTHHHDRFHSSFFSSHVPAHQGSAPADRGRTLPSPSLPERKTTGWYSSRTTI